MPVGLRFAAVAATERIRLAVQKTGTLSWELDIIKAHGLDRKAGLQIETLELASTEAGKIALKGGSADLMLSDWLWVARERSLGDSLVFSPSSSTLGAVMTPARSPISAIADLKGKKLAIAGGPLDKSWLLLQALARRFGVTDAKALSIYRQRYSEGIVRRPLDEEEADARALYLVLAETGGTELVGPARELAPGTFYRPAAGE